MTQTKTFELAQFCETCRRNVNGEMRPIRIKGLRAPRERLICTRCLRNIRNTLPETKLVIWGTDKAKSYWEVPFPIAPTSRNHLAPELQEYIINVEPWFAGLLKLAGFRIEKMEV